MRKSRKKSIKFVEIRQFLAQLRYTISIQVQPVVDELSPLVGYKCTIFMGEAATYSISKAGYGESAYLTKKNCPLAIKYNKSKLHVNVKQIYHMVDFHFHGWKNRRISVNQTCPTTLAQMTICACPHIVSSGKKHKDWDLRFFPCINAFCICYCSSTSTFVILCFCRQ